MFVRVVRFTDVTDERIAALAARIKETGGQPPGVEVTGLEVLYDAGQGTAVVLQHFETAEQMEAAGAGFSAMDPSETPGTRVSVDTCELRARQTQD